MRCIFFRRQPLTTDLKKAGRPPPPPFPPAKGGHGRALPLCPDKSAFPVSRLRPTRRTLQKKAPEKNLRGFLNTYYETLDRAGNFTRTQATGAGVHSAGLAINQRLDPLYIGLPGTVGTTVRMGYLDTEFNFFIAEIAFCHMSAPPLSNRKDYIITAWFILQVFF